MGFWVAFILSMSPARSMATEDGGDKRGEDSGAGAEAELKSLG